MGMGAAYLGFQEIWREWCGYTTAAGYTELPLPPLPSAPQRPARSVRRETRRSRGARAGGRSPAHGEHGAIATERSLTHPPAPAPDPEEEREGREGRGVRRRAGMRARRRRVARWKWSPRSAGRETDPAAQVPTPSIERPPARQRKRARTSGKRTQANPSTPTTNFLAGQILRTIS